MFSGWFWTSLMNHLDHLAATALAVVAGTVALAVVISERVTISLISAGGVVLAAWFGYLAQRNSREALDESRQAREGVVKAQRLAKETHHQVTTNGHSSEKPTLKDDVRDAVDTARAAIAEVQSLRGEIRGLTGQFDRHLDWSVDTVTRLEREIHDKQDRP